MVNQSFFAALHIKAAQYIPATITFLIQIYFPPQSIGIFIYDDAFLRVNISNAVFRRIQCNSTFLDFSICAKN